MRLREEVVEGVGRRKGVGNMRCRRREEEWNMNGGRKKDIKCVYTYCTHTASREVQTELERKARFNSMTVQYSLGLIIIRYFVLLFCNITTSTITCLETTTITTILPARTHHHHPTCPTTSTTRHFGLEVSWGGRGKGRGSGIKWLPHRLVVAAVAVVVRKKG